MPHFQLTRHNYISSFFWILFTLAIIVFLGMNSVWAEKQAQARSGSGDSDQATQELGNQKQNIDNTQPHHIFLPLIAGDVTNKVNTNGERPPVQITVSQLHINHVGNSPEAPPEVNNHTFVADTGGNLDQYLWRDDLPDGRINFTIGIDAPVVDPAWVGIDGFLNATPLLNLIDRGVLPSFAVLTLQVFDVDHEGSPCPEVDYLYVNGRQVQDFKYPVSAALVGGDDAWNAWSIGLPIYLLKFPTSAGVNGQPPTPMNNEIAIEIDTQCINQWQTEVDWGVISLRPNLNYPIIFVHGWRGDLTTFEKFQDFARSNGIQTFRADLNLGIEPIDLTYITLTNQILQQATEWQVDKVNLFAHSKGGLFSRRALRGNAELAAKIDNVITFGTPHHGNNFLPDALAPRQCAGQFGKDTTNYDKCIAAAQEFTRDRIRNDFNYRGCAFIRYAWINCEPRWDKEVWPTVSYYTIVGGPLDVDAISGTYPWRDPCMPEPCTANVDRRYFWHTHTSIKEAREVYDYAISLLASDPQPPNNARMLLDVTAAGVQTATESVIWPDESYQALLNQLHSLSAGGVQTFTVNVDGGDQALFDVLSSVPVSFTLLAPDGRFIDPAVADADPALHYVAQQGDGVSDTGWWHQYQVQNPLAGSWQLTVSVPSAADFLVFGNVRSAISLFVAPQAAAYHPGETVTVEAALLNGNTVLSGTVLSGAVT